MSRTNFGWCLNIQDSGYTRQALLRRKEPTGWDGIEKTFSELGNAGFVLFEHTLAQARVNLLFGTAAGLNRRIPSNRGVMKNQESEDAAKATIKAAIEAATNAATLLGATAMP